MPYSYWSALQRIHTFLHHSRSYKEAESIINNEYDYSNKVTPTAEATTLPAVQTIAPIDTAVIPTDSVSTVVPTDSATTVAPTTPETSAPQGTGSPDATPEPDMLTYPPTVAPAYTD